MTRSGRRRARLDRMNASVRRRFIIIPIPPNATPDEERAIVAANPDFQRLMERARAGPSTPADEFFAQMDREDQRRLAKKRAARFGRLATLRRRVGIPDPRPNRWRKPRRRLGWRFEHPLFADLGGLQKGNRRKA